MRLQESCVRSIVSPSTALLTASRKLPAPLSSQLLTTIACGWRDGAAACAGVDANEVASSVSAIANAAASGRRVGRRAPVRAYAFGESIVGLPTDAYVTSLPERNAAGCRFATSRSDVGFQPVVSMRSTR